MWKTHKTSPLSKDSMQKVRDRSSWWLSVLIFVLLVLLAALVQSRGIVKDKRKMAHASRKKGGITLDLFPLDNAVDPLVAVVGLQGVSIFIDNSLPSAAALVGLVVKRALLLERLSTRVHADVKIGAELNAERTTSPPSSSSSSSPSFWMVCVFICLQSIGCRSPPPTPLFLRCVYIVRI